MKKTLLYPIISAFLVTLSFRTSGLWFLSFFALVPLFCFLYAHDFSRKQLFVGGFVFGFLLSFLITIQVLFAHFLVWFIGALVCGICFGFLALIYCALKRNALVDIFIFASVWVICEWVRQFLFQYFDYTTIAYASYGSTMLLSFASIVGIYGISFILAGINGFIGYFFVYGKSWKLSETFFLFIVVLLGIYFLNQSYLNSGNMPSHEVSFSNIQLRENFWPYATTSKGTLVFNSELDALIKRAALQKTDYVIYPENLVQYVLSDTKKNINVSATFDQANTFLKKNIPSNQTFIFWTDTVRDGSASIYDEADFWRGTSTIAYYQKRNIHPFYDLSHGYFQRAGLYQKPYYYTPSGENKIISIGKDNFGNISCSELNYSYLARRDANAGANIILSLGYASVFEYPALGQLDETIAQLRAAETHLPLIRADVRGPSVFVDRDGRVIRETSVNENTIATVHMTVYDVPQKTLYSIFGDYPLISMVILFLVFLEYLNRIKRGENSLT